jgi:hypothetical protein
MSFVAGKQYAIPAINELKKSQVIKTLACLSLYPVTLISASK